MRPDQERVRNLLLDTVTLLCKNGLDYKKEMKVQGLIGITLDDDDVFLVHFDELSEIPSVAQDEELESEKHGTKRPGDVIDIDLSPAKRPHHAGPGGSTPRRLDLSNTLRQQVPETKPRIKQEIGDDVVILDNDEPEDQKPGLPIEGNIEMDSNQLAALTGFRDGGGGPPPGPGQMGMPGGQGWSPGRVGPPGMPPHGSNQDMFPPSTSMAAQMQMFSHTYGLKTRRPKTAPKPYVCSFEGCGCSFYHTTNLRRHESLKHGRHQKKRAGEGEAYAQYSTDDYSSVQGSSQSMMHSDGFGRGHGIFPHQDEPCSASNRVSGMREAQIAPPPVLSHSADNSQGGRESGSSRELPSPVIKSEKNWSLSDNTEAASFEDQPEAHHVGFTPLRSESDLTGSRQMPT